MVGGRRDVRVDLVMMKGPFERPRGSKRYGTGYVVKWGLDQKERENPNHSQSSVSSFLKPSDQNPYSVVLRPKVVP